MQLTFSGGRELAAALRRLPAELAERHLERAVVAGATLVAEAAARNASRPAIRRRPGTLRLGDSIKVIVTEKTRASVTVNVGTRVPYAHLVEYGHNIIPRGPTRERVSITEVSATGRVRTRFGVDPTQAGAARRSLQVRRAAGASGFVTPQPFLRPAFDENRQAVISRIASELRAGLPAAARAAGARG